MEVLVIMFDQSVWLIRDLVRSAEKVSDFIYTAYLWV